MGNKKSKTKQKENVSKITNKIPESDSIQILLVGGVHSGKSTFYRSISYTHATNINLDANNFTSEIRSNCFYSIQILSETAAKYNIVESLESTADIEHDLAVINTYNNINFSHLNDTQLHILANHINSLWNLQAIQRTFYEYRIKPSHWFALNENMDYFFNKINDIFDPEYIPNTEDILKCRTRSIGAYQQDFEDEKGHKFEIWDVGGQRSERHKWWHRFENINCIIFVCELSAYCKPQEWNEKEIQISECLEKWDYVSNNNLFKRCQMVLLLNKTDLFYKHLQFTPLTACFGEYTGKNYCDFPVDLKMKVCHKLVQLIAKDVDIDINTISMDVIGIISGDCDVLFGYWLDLVYKEGIEFIKNKFLNIHSNALVYEVCAIDMHNVKDTMKQIIKNANFV